MKPGLGGDMKALHAPGGGPARQLTAAHTDNCCGGPRVQRQNCSRDASPDQQQSPAVQARSPDCGGAAASALTPRASSSDIAIAAAEAAAAFRGGPAGRVMLQRSAFRKTAAARPCSSGADVAAAGGAQGKCLHKP